jgi:hypothetical protein
LPIQYDGLSGKVPVYPLYHEGIPNGDYKNTAPGGLIGMKDSYIPIADMSLYHAVPRAVFKAGGAFHKKKPVKVDVIGHGKAVKEISGGFEDAGGYLGTHRHRQSQAFGEVLFGKFYLFPDKLISFSLTIHRQPFSFASDFIKLSLAYIKTLAGAGKQHVNMG